VSAVAALACGGGGAAESGETSAVLAIVSDFKAPDEVSRLSVETVGGTGQVLELGPGKHQFPLNIALVSQSGGRERARVKLALSGADGGDVLARELAFDFVRGGSRTIRIELDRMCARARCGEGRTCVPGWGCVSLDIGADGLPIEKPSRPACDCNSLFPVCVGARWTYRVCTEQELRLGQPCKEKNWEISDFRRAESTMAGGAAEQAFLQFSTSSKENAFKWMLKQGTRLLWWLDETYEPTWKPALTRSYQPGRLRIDEGRTAIGETFTERYFEKALKPGLPTQATEHVDEWTVVSVDTLAMAPRGFASTFCQRHVDTALPTGATPPEDKTFCFARGVGKTYEEGPNQFEFLLKAEVPGCPAFTAAR
jgi:hypothetical protein